mmetsp:Transcript_33422/g.58575  ORF Transcript_33422/g.58575 Transcript_33422/m.58575 type:complete len:221 (+) Transcript_33422:1150-1812(+)
MERQVPLQLATGEVVRFSWESKWLKGEEYCHILQNVDLYCSSFGFQKLSNKCHPESIYVQPQNGLIYFVEGNSVGSEFGFPRVALKKRYRWKKMNFTTELPKRNPVVTYIVASAIKCERFFPGCGAEGPAFRMHAVVTCQPQATAYILCHIRKIAPPHVNVTPLSVPLKLNESASPTKRIKVETEDGLNTLVSAADSLTYCNERDYVSMFLSGQLFRCQN